MKSSSARFVDFIVQIQSQQIHVICELNHLIFLSANANALLSLSVVCTYVSYSSFDFGYVFCLGRLVGQTMPQNDNVAHLSLCPLVRQIVAGNKRRPIICSNASNLNRLTIS